MGFGGSTQKLILDGLEFPVSADNDKNFTKGGRYITDHQDTTQEPYMIADRIAGNLTGAEFRLSHADGTLDNFDAIAQKCANGESVSAMWIPADGAKYTAKSGAWLKIPGAADGMITSREGKLTADIVPKGGEWTRG